MSGKERAAKKEQEARDRYSKEKVMKEMEDFLAKVKAEKEEARWWKAKGNKGG